MQKAADMQKATLDLGLWGALMSGRRMRALHCTSPQGGCLWHLMLLSVIVHAVLSHGVLITNYICPLNVICRAQWGRGGCTPRDPFVPQAAEQMETSSGLKLRMPRSSMHTQGQRLASDERTPALVYCPSVYTCYVIEDGGCCHQKRWTQHFWCDGVTLPAPGKVQV